MNISSVLRDHGVGTGIKPEGTAVPADVLSGKSFINKDGKQVGAMPNRTGNVTGRSISRSGTTLRIAPQTGYYGDTSNVQWSDPNWVATNIKQGVSVFGLIGSMVEGKKWANGLQTPTLVNQRYTVQVRGLSFSPSLIISMSNSISVSEFTNFSLFVSPSLFPANSRTLQINTISFDTPRVGTMALLADGFDIQVNGHQQLWIAFE